MDNVVLSTVYAEPFQETRYGIKWSCPKCNQLNREYSNEIIVLIGKGGELGVKCMANSNGSECGFDYTISKRQLIKLK